MMFRALLEAEFHRRRAANRRYSLRAFARALSVNHSTLSQMLRGMRRLTARTVLALGRRLHLAASEIAEFAALEHEAAVLDAIRRPGFRPDSRWLATVTAIPVDAVNTTLQRLLRKRTLAMASRVRWVQTGEVARG
jgi:transcriptional regulator with XRE-family HTH domain